MRRLSSGRHADMPADFFESLLRLKAKLVYAGGVCGRWGIDHNSDTTIWYHLVSKGRAWVHYPGTRDPLQLDEGDMIVFLPHAAPHFLSYSPAELRFDYPEARKSSWEEGQTAFVCAVIDLGLTKAGLWNLLPAQILIRRGEGSAALADLTRHVIDEAREQRFGSFSVIERLCDSIFVLMVRHCIEQGQAGESVVMALHDRRLDTVLSLIHREPWYPWTVSELGKRAGMSKTVLTERFTQLIGCPPGEYLVRWRMQTAANWLRESRLPLEVVAERCGYQSVSAFSRQFKGCYGVSPGAYRSTPHAEAASFFGSPPNSDMASAHD